MSASETLSKIIQEKRQAEAILVQDIETHEATTTAMRASLAECRADIAKCEEALLALPREG
jgi:hypothetical protein